MAQHVKGLDERVRVNYRRRMPNLNLTGTLKVKRFGDVTELFLGDRAVPFYADIQQIVRRHSSKPIIRMTIGDVLHVEGELDVFCQRRGSKSQGDHRSVSTVFEKRFSVDGFDLRPVLADGTTVQIELIL